MMPALGSEVQSPARLRATPIDHADFDGLAFFLHGSGLPTSDLRKAGRVFYRVEAEDLVGYGGIEGEGPDRLLRSLVLLPDRRHVGMGGVVLALIENEAEGAGVERLHLLTTTPPDSFERRAMQMRPAPRHRPQSPPPPSSARCVQPAPLISSNI